MTTGDEAASKILFPFFNEIGIIHQLASARFGRLLPDGVHIAHFAIINHMVRLGDDRTPQQLVRAMQVTKATMTHSLKVLQSHRFITVEPDPMDGRGKRVKLTKAGREFRETAIMSLTNGLAPIASELLAQDVAGTTQRLKQVREVLDRSRNT